MTIASTSRTTFSWIVYFDIDMTFESLRSEHGFRALVEKLGVP